MSSNHERMQRLESGEARSVSLTDRIEPSTRIVVDIKKAVNVAYDIAAGDSFGAATTSERADFEVFLSGPIENVVALEVESLSFTDVAAKPKSGVGLTGTPYVPYFSLEIVDMHGGLDCRVARNTGNRASDIRGMPIILSNSGYDSVDFSTPSFREYKRYTLPLGRLERLKIHVRGPEDDPFYINPLFSRMVMVMRAIHPEEPSRRPIRGADRRVTGEMLAAESRLAQVRGATWI